MNREIKFRGKSIRNGKWLHGYLAEAKGKVLQSRYAEKVIFENLEWFNTDNFGYVLNDYAVDPDTIGQFTGLTDKAGKGIYEGDILKFYKVGKRGNSWNWCDPLKLFIEEEKGKVIFADSTFLVNTGIYSPVIPLAWCGFKSINIAIEKIGMCYLQEDKGFFTDINGTKIDEHILGIEVIGNIHDTPELLNE